MRNLLTIIVLLSLVCAAGCTKSVREYHTAAKDLRAVVEVEGLADIPEPHKTALKVWAEKRDAAMKLPEAAVKAYKSNEDLKTRVGYLRRAVKR